MRAITALCAAVAVSLTAAPAFANKLNDAQTAFADLRDDEALTLFAEAMAEPGASPETKAAAHFGRGEVLALNNKHDDAIADFTAALALPQDDGDRAITYYSRAESLIRRNRLDEAIQDYSQSYALSPDQVGVLTARGTAYNRQGKTTEALADFDAELKRRPTYYRALSSRAALLNLPPPPNPETGRR